MDKLRLILLAAALLACSDDKDKEASAEGNVTDASNRDDGKKPSKATSQLDLPGELTRPPSDGRVPADLRPPSARTTEKKGSP